MEDRVIWSGPKAVRSMLEIKLYSLWNIKTAGWVILFWNPNKIWFKLGNIGAEVMSVVSDDSDISWVVVW